MGSCASIPVSQSEAITATIGTGGFVLSATVGDPYNLKRRYRNCDGFDDRRPRRSSIPDAFRNDPFTKEFEQTDFDQAVGISADIPGEEIESDSNANFDLATKHLNQQRKSLDPDVESSNLEMQGNPVGSNKVVVLLTPHLICLCRAFLSFKPIHSFSFQDRPIEREQGAGPHRTAQPDTPANSRPATAASHRPPSPAIHSGGRRAAPPVDAVRLSPPRGGDLAAKLALLAAERQPPPAPPPALAPAPRRRTDSWTDRLRDTALAKQLSFLKDKAAERVVRGQASKEVERQYGGPRRVRPLRAPPRGASPS